MNSRDTRLTQRHISGKIFEITYKGRYFLFNSYPIRVIEIEQPVEDNQLDEEILKILGDDVEASVILQPSFSGFAAVELISTTNCNLRCTHCTARDFDQDGAAKYYGMPASDMSSDTMIAAIEAGIVQLEKRLQECPVDVPVFEMFITGGEPMLVWENLKVAFTYARQRLAQIPGTTGYVFTPHIVTNGTLIDEAVAKEMVDYKVQVTIALDSPYNQVRVNLKKEAATPEALRGLKNLVAAGHKQTSVNVVIAGEDMPILDDVMAYLENLDAFKGITTIQVSPLAPPIAHTEFAAKGLTAKHSGFNNQGVCESFSDKLIEYSIRYGLDMKSYGNKLGNWLLQGGTQHRCPVAEWKWAATPNGDVYACHQLVGIEQFKMGNLANPNWYESESAQVIRNRFVARTVDKTDLCPECVLNSSCMVFVDCPARSFLEMGDEKKIVPHYCECGKKYLETLLGEQIISLIDSGNIKSNPLKC